MVGTAGDLVVPLGEVVRELLTLFDEGGTKVSSLLSVGLLVGL